MKLTLGEISKLVGGELIGDPGIIIRGISGIKEAKEGDITFLANSKYFPLMATTKASAIITSREDFDSSKPLIKADNPSIAFAKVVGLAAPSNNKHFQGIHPTAVVSKGVKLGPNVAIGAYTVIEESVEIGPGTIIYSGCYIGCDTKIGKDCLIYPHVSIRERIEIGARVIIHPGAVIGSDGFGFAMVRGVQKKIPQIGTVSIEDDAEIGANVTIDRARFDKTIIGKGVTVGGNTFVTKSVPPGSIVEQVTITEPEVRSKKKRT